MTSANTLQAHPELWPAMDGPMDDDRRWFIAHPSETIRLRPQMPDELEAREAMAQAMGGPGDIRIGAGDLPTTWMVVVDVLRAHGMPPAADGKSCRIRLACPEPQGDAMAEAIKAMALEMVLALRQPRPRRTGGRGFGT